MVTQELNTNWQFRKADDSKWHPAEVPGCIHTDLMNEGQLHDPFIGRQEKHVQWVELEDWEYACTFDVDPALITRDHIELVFAGLDTYADVILNGQHILAADNMFRTWQVDVKTHLTETGNTLHIHFRSPIKENRAKVESLPYTLPSNEDAPYGGTSVFTRKAPYQYGWDWGPRLVTCGIWKHVTLNGWSDVRINDLTVRTAEVDIQHAVLDVIVEIESTVEMKGELHLSDETETITDASYIQIHSGKTVIEKQIILDDPILWWPNGYGDAFLYTLHARVITDQAEWEIEQRIGIRSVELRRAGDVWGESFTFIINGVRIFAKGANWIPADSFTPRITKERYRYLLQSAVDVNMNMLRIWGGGIYEDEMFYRLCDELGIMLWQDFMFACSLYPGDADFLESVRLEAIDQVRRLRNHASIVLWCGNNELAQGWKDWSWTEQLPASVKSDYNRLFHERIPAVCREHDPSRAYWPSSGGSYADSADDPNNQQRGDIHYWGVWHGKEPFEAFEQQYPRFCSEFGFQSFPDMKTISRFAAPRDYDIFSEVMKHHQRSGNGNALIKEYMKMYYKVPDDFERFVMLSQVLQAEGLKRANEHFRRISPRCMGALYWQLNDCWPVASWASIDYDGRWKALHYYARRFFKSILVSIYETDDAYMVAIVSDEGTAVDGELRIKHLTMNGETLQSWNQPVTVKPLESAVYFVVEKKDIEPADFMIYTALRDCNDQHIADNIFYFQKPKDQALQSPNIEMDIDEIEPGYFQISLTSDVAARNVYVDAGDLAGRFEDNWIDLVPGQPKTIFLNAHQTVDAASLQRSLTVRSLFDLMQ